MTVRTNARLRELLDDRVALVAAGDPVERLRAIKEPGELEKIRAATELADAAVREIMEQDWRADRARGRGVAGAGMRRRAPRASRLIRSSPPAPWRAAHATRARCRSNAASWS